jgi:hypothetical protein
VLKKPERQMRPTVDTSALEVDLNRGRFIIPERPGLAFNSHDHAFAALGPLDCLDSFWEAHAKDVQDDKLVVVVPVSANVVEGSSSSGDAGGTTVEELG